MVEQRGRSVAILEVEASVVLAPDIVVVTRNLDKRLLVGILHQNHELATSHVIANQLANQFRRRLPLAQVLALDFHVTTTSTLHSIRDIRRLTAFCTQAVRPTST